MGQLRKSATIIISDNKGWTLVYTLAMVLLILSVSLSAFAAARFRMIGGRCFENILKENNPDLSSHTDIEPISGAPEKWDHMLFSADLIRVSNDELSSHYLKSRAANQPADFIKEVRLSCNRPYVYYLIQNSESMRWASSRDYDEKAIYLKRKDGEICLVDFFIGDMNTSETDDGIYFKGSYGNTHYRASTSSDSPYAGAMPSSTLYMPSLIGICGVMGMAETEIETVSGKPAMSHHKKSGDIIKQISSMLFDEKKAGIAESLLKLIDKFPAKCITGRHIIVLTDGLAIDDGTIPETIRDFDKDSNPYDTHISGIGSHCFDDVCSYASSKGVTVHVVGPESGLLESAAEKGKGKIMPSSEDIFKETPFISTMPIVYKGKTVFLENRYGRFNPSWMDSSASTFYRVNAYGGINACPKYDIPGPVSSSFLSGDMIYVTTAGDSLNQIDLSTGRLKWSVKGPGGRVQQTGTNILAGPSSIGTIFCLSNSPELIWEKKGKLFQTAGNMVFISDGNSIIKYELSSGISTNSFSFDEEITSLNMDPVENLLYAGTSGGKILVLTLSLALDSLVAIDSGEEIHDVHAYTYRKSLYLTGQTSGHVFCADNEKMIWSKKVPGDEAAQIVVMDGRLYCMSWTEDGDCGGIDTGQSYLSVYDAISGKLISEEALMTGRPMGPFIDIDGCRLLIASYDMDIHESDVSSLHGAKQCFIGSRLPGLECLEGSPF